MATRILNTVSYHEETVDGHTVKTLSLSDSEITLHDGEWVEWDFANTPAGSVGFIFFDADPGVGPFQRLRFFSSTSVLGFGNVGPREQEPGQEQDPNEYGYKALLLGSNGVVGTPVSGKIKNHATSIDTSPNGRAIIAPDPNHEGKFLVTIEPPDLFLVQGDTATWRVENLDANHFINLRYKGTLAITDPLGGPFQTYELAAEGEDPLILAYGFNFNGQLGVGDQAIYTIEVRKNDTGELVGTGDPQIDNLGPPINN